MTTQLDPSQTVDASFSGEALTNTRKYVFANVDDLAVYLCKIYPAITPIKLQKGLYFLYAYYVGTFTNVGLTEEDIEFPDVSFYPPELFKPEFQAWQLGPVISDVYYKFRQGFYKNKAKQLNPKELFPEDDPLGMEMKLFIDAFFLKRVCRLNDFALVDRSHSDKAWIEAWGDGSNRGQTLDPQLIKDEYIGMFKNDGTMYA